MAEPTHEADAAVTRLLAALGTPAMPDAVWHRLAAALTLEAANRNAATDQTARTSALGEVGLEDAGSLAASLADRAAKDVTGAAAEAASGLDSPE